MHVSNYICYLWKIDQVLWLFRIYLNAWEYIDPDVRSSFEFRIYYKVLDSNCIDRYCLFEIIAILTHHVVENSIHILPQEILVIFLEIKRSLFLFLIHFIELLFDLPN